MARNQQSAGTATIVSRSRLIANGSEKSLMRVSFPQCAWWQTAFRKGVKGGLAILVTALPAAGAVFTTHLWPGGVVPYELDDSLDVDDENTLLEAMSIWERAAAVDFRERDGESDFVRFVVGYPQVEGSVVGRQRGEQFLAVGGVSLFRMVHSLGHCLGFWHETSRADRDAYVDIIDPNICETCCFGPPCDTYFDINPEAGVYGPYDFDSIMHYSACEFSCCNDNPPCRPDPIGIGCTSAHGGCRTIVVRPPHHDEWQQSIGQRDHFSSWDQRVMSFLYPYADWRFVDLNHGGGNRGTFFDPYASLSRAMDEMPDGGTLWFLEPDTYSAVGVYSRPMTWRAGYLTVTLK